MLWSDSFLCDVVGFCVRFACVFACFLFLRRGNPRHARRMLRTIAGELRERVPFEAQAPGEKIVFPQKGEFAGCDASNSVHVDAFLYDDDAVDQLVDAGKLSRSYCTKCGSQDTRELTFVSHSISHSQARFIFRDALPPLDSSTTVVDVGSRLGALLYAGYLYCPSARFVGVEMSDYFCKLQEEIIAKHSFGDRINIVCADVRSQGELLKKADVVLLNNVFQFFVDEAGQQAIWRFLRESIRKKGALVISVPSLQEALEQAGLAGDKILDGWLEKVELAYPLNDDGDPDEESDALNVHMYTVL
ncbi:hypothetical protein CAOG_002198 [Capsaspora owczarzaki ATCC 30864]|uniref:Methyltransferase type 11 domain-containing protein n=1 Tax=Capsaspora owczarzaki (strain ATCC 30864) TaxID=595528 RepID=A0A0D2WLU9_CAPO3|nr:hypothetical protein CAOG_002198 [Capsaspora owczarzaki ATCC 30864]